MKLTISMATYDDYDGCFFSISSLRLHHPVHLYDTEFLVIDNNPGSAHSNQLKHLASHVDCIRIVEQPYRQSSFVKYGALSLAKGDVILGIDCHVLFECGAIKKMMDYFEAHPHTKNMLTGPLIHDGMKECFTHMDPIWSGHDFGTWGQNKEGLKSGQPFEVPMQGMACFALLRENAPNIPVSSFAGFGAEEWFVAETVRQNGGKVVCHPEMGWIHRFDWPKRTFAVRAEDRLFNYFTGWLRLYGDEKHLMVRQMIEYNNLLYGKEVVAQQLARAKAALSQHRHPPAYGTCWSSFS